MLNAEEDGFPLWLSGKESACNTGDASSIPGLGRFPGVGNGNPLQYSCLGNAMDSAFFTVQLSYPFMTTGETIALTRQTFVAKVMSLPYNMLSRLVITFLSRSKCLLISWLKSPSAVILKPPKIKSVTVSPSVCYEVMGPDAMMLVF